MQLDCEQPVTHIGAKGYVYCTAHAPERRGVESTRRMKAWEVEHIMAERPLLSYAPISQAEDVRRRAAANLPAALAADYFLHSVDCARHAADVSCSRACIERLPGEGWTATVSPLTAAARLEEIRAEIDAERASYGELAELRSLAAFIADDDVVLREWAGLPEFGQAAACTCSQWFENADGDEGRDDGGHEHRDAGEGCTAPGCACDFTAPDDDDDDDPDVLVQRVFDALIAAGHRALADDFARAIRASGEEK